MGGYTSSKIKGRGNTVERAVIPPPVYRADLVERLFNASSLVNEDIKRTLAETYATLLLQIEDLRERIIRGVISVDEARTLPPLINHLRKTAADLRLLKSGEEMGLSLNPFSIVKAGDDEMESDVA